MTDWEEFNKCEDDYTLSPFSAWETCEVYHRGRTIGTIQAISNSKKEDEPQYLVLMRSRHKSGKMVTQIVGVFNATEDAFHSIKVAHFTHMYKW
jgi:hypothetical protein